MVTQKCLHLKPRIFIDGAVTKGTALRLLAPEAVCAGKDRCLQMFRADLMDAKGAPVMFVQIPVIALQLALHPAGDARGAEDVENSGGDMVVADKGIHAHEMVHVGMADKNGVDGSQHALCQMVELAAVEEESPPQWTDIDQKQRVVQKAGKKCGFHITKWQTVVHDANITYLDLHQLNSSPQGLIL
ncbi:hypothetical protein JCM15764A_00590 [Geotalea toluenoxydans]